MRTELVERLRQRFHLRVVAVVAGPGFGKSTLLAQTHAANRLSPEGSDRWLRCGRGDEVASQFVAGLAAATGLRLERPRMDADSALDEVLAHVAASWPFGMALTLDDVHLVGGDATHLLRRLIAEAPPCLHLVLASRRPVQGLTLVRSRGEVAELTEADLRLTDVEIAELGRRHGVALTELAPAAGWPALTDVLARGRGGDGSGWEVALEGLDPRNRRAVAETVAVGGGPLTALGAALSDPPPLDQLLTDLPMVDRHDDGTIVPHQLWERVVEGVLSDDEARAVRSRMASWLLDHGDVTRAVRLAAEAEDWATLAAGLVDACSRGYAGPPPDLLGSWFDLVPDHLAEAPEALLLRGVHARAVAPFSEATRDLLEAAMLGFRGAGDVAGEVAALSEYTYVVRLRGEPERLPPVLVRLMELDGTGHPEVEGPIQLARALLAETTGPDELVLAELDAVAPGSLIPQWMAVVDYLRCQVLLNMGRTGDAVVAADRAVAHGGPDYLGGRYAASLARWYHGDPTSALELPPADEPPGATPVDRVYMGLYTAVVGAFAGRVARARHDLAVAEAALDEQARPHLRAEVAGARAAVSVAAGDETGAAKVLAGALAELPVGDPAARGGHVRFLALVHVLCPGARDELDALPLGPSHQTTLAVAHSFEAARAGDLDAAGADLPSADDVAVRLPLRWAAELAARLDEGGHPGGRTLAAGLAARHGLRLREVLRDLAPSRRGAARLLGTVTVDTGAAVRIGLLGSTTLVVEDEPVDGGPWRRRAVRQLLAHLVARSEVSRDELCAALWPDADQAAAERNLRATLAHLVRLLEPHRANDEAPFLVRADPAIVSQAGPPHVEVDLHRFDELLDQAADLRTAAPSQALPRYRAALDLWRGEPYADFDIAEAPWVGLERDRLRGRFVEAALRSAEIHLATGDADLALARAADALAVERASEEAHRLLVAAHLAAGEAAPARRAADRALATLDELGLAPSPETQMVLRLVDQRAAET